MSDGIPVCREANLLRARMWKAARVVRPGSGDAKKLRVIRDDPKYQDAKDALAIHLGSCPVCIDRFQKLNLLASNIVYSVEEADDDDEGEFYGEVDE